MIQGVWRVWRWPKSVSSGRYSATLPVGTYTVTDGYADQFTCAITPVLTPATIKVVGGPQTQDITTTGCIV